MEINVAAISTEIKEIIEDVLKGRKVIKWIMSSLIILPFILVAAGCVVAFINNDAKIALLISPVLSISALAFVYVGKLQDCDDRMHQYKIIVVASQDIETIVKSSKIISCYGKFDGIFDRIDTIITNLKNAPAG